MNEFILSDNDFASILDSFEQLHRKAVDRKDYLTCSMIREEVRKLLSGDGPMFKIEDSIGICDPFGKVA